VSTDLTKIDTGAVKRTVKVGFIRKLYNWVLHWAETPYGSLALIILAFAESSFFFPQCRQVSRKLHWQYQFHEDHFSIPLNVLWDKSSAGCPVI
jgi:hypothetical protein